MAPRVHAPSEEYRALVDKAYNKFARLREFPAYGRNKWDFYFHKAFQVYSKLWKYQQENRAKLVEMGLKRWEIGEIASRIGQLYYNYYLRTSDAKFLTESYIFYDAISSREYFKEPHDNNNKDVALANKQLRYTARFIVICLLLNRRDTVQLLVRQLRVLVEEYTRTFQEGTDAKDWKIVVQEIFRFMKADAVCDTSRPLRYCLLYDPHPSLVFHKVEGKRPLHLEDSILASYYHNEVKFSELTLDTFRMLQVLEWEPSGSLFKARTEAGTGGSGGIGVSDEIPDPSLPPNPHKYILYRPTVQELLLVLATACDELSPDGVVLLYISASGRSARMSSQNLGGAPQPSKKGVVSLTPTLSLKNMNVGTPQTEITPYSEAAAPKRDEIAPSTSAAATGTKDVPVKRAPPEPPGSGSPGLWLGSKKSPGYNFLYPSDILPFTRRPLFLIIDSDSSFIFESISGEERGEQAILLLSSSMQPVEDKGVTSTSSPSSLSHSSGSMFTFFLTAPLLAFCRVIEIPTKNMSKANYEQTEKLLATLISEWGNVLDSAAPLDPVWGRVLGDPFLRQLICRFIFCRAVFGLHSKYRSKPEHTPRCCPALPDEVLPSSKVVETVIYLLASRFGVSDQFDCKLTSTTTSTTSSSSSTTGTAAKKLGDGANGLFKDEATTTAEDFLPGEASSEDYSDERNT